MQGEGESRRGGVRARRECVALRYRKRCSVVISTIFTGMAEYLADLDNPPYSSVGILPVMLSDIYNNNGRLSATEKKALLEDIY